MDLNLYFEPVALDKPDHNLLPSKAMLGQHIHIHTPSSPIGEISNYQVALFGICEDRNSLNQGSSHAPDKIRASFYQLFMVQDKMRIIDLGNLKIPDTVNDTYFGVRDVMMELLGNQVVVVVMGGMQDLTCGIYMAFEKIKKMVNVVTIDARLDLEGAGSGGSGWIEEILRSPCLMQYTNLGHQQYLTDRNLIKQAGRQSFESVRLGSVRSNLGIAEPLIRDAHLVSFDVTAIKQSDSPGTMFPSPNGFIAEEACQLARYAGLSDRVSCFGIFEYNPSFDFNNQSAHLNAQIIWHFIEGYAQRKEEKPAQNNADFKVFVVSHQDMEHELVFYKSLTTNRWWMEVPGINEGKSVVIACTAEDYQLACRHEIPDLWWKIFQRIN